MSAAEPVATTVEPRTPSQEAEGLRRFFVLDLLDNRYPALHGLRVLAILTVVQYHVTWFFRPLIVDQELAEMSLRIFFGMDLFFILSGFLIGSILLRSLQLSGTQNLRRFYLRRVFRTFPSYYVVLTVLALTLKLTPEQRHNLPWEYVYATTFLSLHHGTVTMVWGWSLALEEQFYLTVPLLFFVLHRMRSERARIALLGALWVIALVVRLVIYLRSGPWPGLELYFAIYYRTHTRFDTLVAGILLAFVHDRHGPAIGAWLTHPRNRTLLAMPAMACLWLLLRPTMFGLPRMQLVQVFAWGTVTSVMYLPTLLLLLHGQGWVHRLLSAPLFRRAATLGYGVYLVHLPIIEHGFLPVAVRLMTRRVPMTVLWPAGLLAATVISFTIAYGMHLLLEKPALWVRQRLAA
jgi:peptidoglycan/LPS O-acetylase OafA/YrhL